RTGHRLGHVVPTRILRRTEVRSVEDLLQTEDLNASPSRLLDERNVERDRRFLDLLDRRPFMRNRNRRLDEPCDYLAIHFGFFLHESQGHMPEAGVGKATRFTPPADSSSATTRSLGRRAPDSEKARLAVARPRLASPCHRRPVWRFPGSRHGGAARPRFRRWRSPRDALSFAQGKPGVYGT